MLRHCLAAALLIVFTTTCHGSEFFKLKIQNNYRLFQDGSTERYLADLRNYLNCASKTIPFDGERCGTLKRFKKCRDNQNCYPNLRSGRKTNPYSDRYLTKQHRFRKGYAWPKHARIRIEIPKNLGTHSCRWRFSNRTIAQKNCKPIAIRVPYRFAHSEDGFNELSYSIRVSLDILKKGVVINTHSKQFSGRDYLIVVLGDSFASGEGNPHLNRTSNWPAEWQDYRCNRSAFNYSQIASAWLAASNPQHSFTVVDLSCSGAEIYDGVIRRSYQGRVTGRQLREQFGAIEDIKRIPGRVGTRPLPTQLKQAVRNLRKRDSSGQYLVRTPDVVILSLGGNDMGFGELVRRFIFEDCGSACQAEIVSEKSKEEKDCNPNNYVSESRLFRSWSCLGKGLSELNEELASRLRARHVLTMDYLNPLFDRKGRLCMSEPNHKAVVSGWLRNLAKFIGAPVELSQSEINFAFYKFLVPLRKKAKAAVSEINRSNQHTKWEYVSFDPKKDFFFERRGFCAQDGSWFHNYNDSLARLGILIRDPLSKFQSRISTGMLHPNAYGHFNVSQLLLDRLITLKIFRQERLARKASARKFLEEGLVALEE